MSPVYQLAFNGSQAGRIPTQVQVEQVLLPNMKTNQEISFKSTPSPAPFDAEVVGYRGDSHLVERLKELGIFQGLRVSYLGRAPFSGPMMFRFGAMVLALREEEVACLRLNRC